MRKAKMLSESEYWWLASALDHMIMDLEQQGRYEEIEKEVEPLFAKLWRLTRK